jgi:hypothetical protein
MGNGRVAQKFKPKHLKIPSVSLADGLSFHARRQNIFIF